MQGERQKEPKSANRIRDGLSLISLTLQGWAVHPAVKSIRRRDDCPPSLQLLDRVFLYHSLPPLACAPTYFSTASHANSSLPKYSCACRLELTRFRGQFFVLGLLYHRRLFASILPAAQSAAEGGRSSEGIFLFTSLKSVRV